MATKSMQSPETDADHQSPAHDVWSGQASRKQNGPESVDINANLLTHEPGLPKLNRPPFLSLPGWETRLHSRPVGRDAARRYAAGEYITHWNLHNIESQLCEGDTLIFVDFPPSPAGKYNNGCFVHEWTSVHFRVSSHKLRATGSTKFADMLNANYQSRIQRERNLLNKLPQGIRFVLDLTPPSEEEDLISQVREVALTPGIIGWWTASEKYSVDDRVVFGHDDVCTCSGESGENGKGIPKYSYGDEADLNLEGEAFWLGSGRPNNLSLLSRTWHGAQPYVGRRFTGWKRRVKQTAGQVPAKREIPEYCPVRHRVGILRLLLLIEDRPVLVDSAPLAWTLVAVANTFDCAGVVRDVFLKWLMSPNNAVIVEVLPEESLQLGFTLRLDDVTRSAFRILVNELALEQAADDARDIHKIAPYTVFGRKRHNPGNRLNKLIQHAAYAMFQRVSQFSQRFVSKTIFEDLRVPEWELLQSLLQMPEGRPEAPAFREFEDVAQNFRRALNRSTGYIADATLGKHLNWSLLASIDDYRATHVDTAVFRPFDLIYKDFNIVQKFMCYFLPAELNYCFIKMGTILSLEFTLFDADLRAKLDKYPDLRKEFANACLSAPKQFGIRGSQDSFRALISSFEKHFILPKLSIPIKATRQYMLLTLTQNEFRFLPPWAGGSNDGTGSVSEDSLFPAGHGPEETYHTDPMISSDASDLPDYFMKMRYGGARYIDIRRHQDICELAKPCNCLPPTDLVVPQGTEYRCSPIPAMFSPPVGPRLMMDYFTNPDDIPANSTLVLQQLPKRTCGRLSQEEHTEIVEAWGIYYKEDWDWEKIKYFNNVYNAIKISYFIKAHAICAKVGLDGHLVGAAVSRSAEGMWNPLYGTRCGVPDGGACLPKDTEAFLHVPPVPSPDKIDAVLKAVRQSGGALGEPEELLLEVGKPTPTI
ncbi:hypothetical protein CSHISOI_09887, partial [Colletotrichum shisoi]